MTQKPGDGQLKPRASLRLRLLLALTIALMPIFFLGLFQAWIDARQNLEQRRIELISAADSAIDRLEQRLSRAEGYLHLLSETISSGECQKVMETLRNDIPGLYNVVYFNAEGTAVCTVHGDPGFSITNPVWHERMRSGEERIRTGSFLAPFKSGFLFGLLERVENAEGQFEGAVGFGLDAQSISEFLRGNLDNPALDIAIASGDGMVFGSSVFHTIKPEWLSSAAPERGAKSRLIADQEVNGEPRDVIIARIRTGEVGENISRDEDGIYVVVSRRSPGLFSEFVIAPATAIGLPLLAFIFVFATVWISIDHLVLRWLKRLKRIALIYGGGRYTLRSGDSFDAAPGEIAELAETLDIMAERVGTRDTNLREALANRDAAVKEIHHRVKNNLQIVTSFLNLQSRQVADPAARSALAAARHRIDALSIVHRTLYQHEKLEIVDIKPFLEGLLSHLSGALGMEESETEFTWAVAEAECKVDDAIPLALFVVETVTNAVKHGPEFEGRINVDLSHIEEKKFRMTVTNLVGERDDFEIASTGLGSKLMLAFAKQLKGEMSTEAGDDGSYSVKLDLELSGA